MSENGNTVEEILGMGDMEMAMRSVADKAVAILNQTEFPYLLLIAKNREERVASVVGARYRVEEAVDIAVTLKAAMDGDYILQMEILSILSGYTNSLGYSEGGEYE